MALVVKCDDSCSFHGQLQTKGITGTWTTGEGATPPENKGGGMKKAVQDRDEGRCVAKRATSVAKSHEGAELR